MIYIKKEKDIAIMYSGGAILAKALDAALSAVRVGITELELDSIAEKTIRDAGAESGFKKVDGYRYTICAATNDVVVHGIPTKRVLQEGDIIGIDCGVYLGGFHTDMAETVLVSDLPVNEQETVYADTLRFLRIGKKAMWEGIGQVGPGKRVGHISQAMQKVIEDEGGYGVVKSLVGHGVGRELHEEPEIPGFLSQKIDKTPLLMPGMTIAIEIIYTKGDPEVVYANDDDWTIATLDGSLSGLFERSLVVTQEGYSLLTPRD
jgi:methionyl aminopeptidase